MKRLLLLVSLCVLLAPVPMHVHAYIERLYSLEEVLAEATNVVVGRIKSIDRRKQTAVAVIERPLKGDLEYQEVQMNIGLAAPDHTPYVMAQLEKDAPYLLYYKRDGDNIASCAHTGDTWIQLYANHEEDRKSVWWRMSHVEIYMNRTFRGGTKDLIRLKATAPFRRTPPRE